MAGRTVDEARGLAMDYVQFALDAWCDSKDVGVVSGSQFTYTAARVAVEALLANPDVVLRALGAVDTRLWARNGFWVHDYALHQQHPEDHAWRSDGDYCWPVYAVPIEGEAL